MKHTLSFLLACLVSMTTFAQETLLHCGKIIDTQNGKVLKEQTITILGNQIVSVEKGYASAKSGQKVIDLKTKTVMPGFIDMHVHIEGETNPKQYLETFTKNEADIAFTAAEIAERTLLSGFTTVRDLGGSGVNVSLRNAINSGTTRGPRIYTAEKAIGTTGGHADPTNGFKKVNMGDPGPVSYTHLTLPTIYSV